MNLHFFQDLSDNSPEISEFKTLLKYSLCLYDTPEELLPYQLSFPCHNADCISSYIDAIFNKCHSICKPLFDKSHPYYFFGSPKSYTQTDIASTYSNLFFYPDFWETAIKYHCVISSLHTLLYYFSKDITLSSYKFCNHFQGKGYFSSMQAGILFINDKQELTLLRHKKSGYSGEYASASSNFPKTFKTFAGEFIEPEDAKPGSKSKSKLSKLEKAVLGIKSKNNFAFFNSDLLYYLYYTSKVCTKCKALKNFYEENDIPFSFQKYFDIAEVMESGLTDRLILSSDKVDYILLKYKFERYYNFSLTDCIIKFLVNFSNEHSSFTINSIPVEILSATFNLPNVFSRNEFFKYALYSFNNARLEDSTFYKRNQDTGPIFTVGTPTNHNNRLIIWLDLYKKFITFFSYIIIPIYERCFFIILKEHLSLKKTDVNFMQESIELLHQYILSHIDDILEFKDQGELAKVFSDSNSSISDVFSKSPLTKHQKQVINIVTKELLINQDNIFHPAKHMPLSSKYFGIISNENYHRKLMNLVVQSVLEQF